VVDLDLGGQHEPVAGHALVNACDVRDERVAPRDDHARVAVHAVPRPAAFEQRVAGSVVGLVPGGA